MLCSRFFDPSVDLADFYKQHIPKREDDEGNYAAHDDHKDKIDGDWLRVRKIHTYNDVET